MPDVAPAQPVPTDREPEHGGPPDTRVAAHTGPGTAAQVLDLLGEQVLVLHGPAMDEGDIGLSGQDVDCFVRGLDPTWPLRLTEGWRLCQVLRYDLLAWYWVLERGGRVLALDTTDDPWGLGRDAIRTSAFVRGLARFADPATRAAYLAIKRVRKHGLTDEEWARIGRLANADPEAFHARLQRGVGRRLAEHLLPWAIEGRPPETAAARRLNLDRYLRRFGSPFRLGLALALGIRRYAERIGRPVGIQILIVGPDGSGKSTVARALPRLCEGLFKRLRHSHWRPGFLPRPGALLGRAPSDPSRPHERAPLGLLPSLVLLGYYWLDFLLGKWLGDLPTRIRAGLLVRERGWWDLAVDPGRYRLSVPSFLVRVLGHTLRRPDLAIVLEGDPGSLYDRKPELSIEELGRQLEEWHRVLPRRVRQLRVDATRPPEAVLEEVREGVLALMEARAVSRLGAGWARLPLGAPRFWIPRGPRGVTGAALSIFQPVSPRARIVWETARIIASLGGFRVAARGEPPPAELRRRLAPHIPRRGTMAVVAANHPARWIALILDGAGRPTVVAKVAADPDGERALQQEAWALEHVARLLPEAVAAPRLVGRGSGLLLLDPVPWKTRPRPWELDPSVAGAMGAFFRAGATVDGRGLRGPCHGDFAPWNLLWTGDRWVLVDWEAADERGEPFADLATYLVQASSLLGRPSEEALVTGLRDGAGSVGHAVAAYAEAAGLDTADAPGAVAAYLRRTRGALRPGRRSEVRGVRRRDRLLERLEA